MLRLTVEGFYQIPFAGGAFQGLAFDMPKKGFGDCLHIRCCSSCREVQLKADIMQLYSRAASSCSFRVRIALNLKCLTCELIPVEAKDQSAQSFRNINPQGLVPVLVVRSSVLCWDPNWPSLSMASCSKLIGTASFVGKSSIFQERYVTFAEWG